MNQRIKIVRKKLGMSQEQLAVALGLKQGSYSDIERGRNNISKPVALLLEKNYNVNLKWLETGEGDMFDHPIIAQAKIAYDVDAVERGAAFSEKKESMISQNLKHLRELTGLSQTQLGEELGLTRGQIASYESGTNIKPDTMVAICKYFKQELSVFMTTDLTGAKSVTIDESGEYRKEKAQAGGITTSDVELLREIIKAKDETIAALKAKEAAETEARKAQHQAANPIRDLKKNQKQR